MSIFKIALTVSLSLFLSNSYAQGATEGPGVAGDFLTQVDPQVRADLVSRSPIKAAEYEYFAKPGTFGVYRFDVDVLKTKGETITLRLFNGPPIEILSRGLSINYDRGGNVARWTGELSIPNSKRKYPVHLVMGIWAVDSNGNLKLPDPNREVTRQLMEQEHYAVLQDSYQRRDEKIVYELVNNSIYVPSMKATIEFAQLSDDPETVGDLQYVVVYEMDEERRLLLGDDLPRADGKGDVSAVAADRERRLLAYESYMKDVRRKLGQPQVEE